MMFAQALCLVKVVYTVGMQGALTVKFIFPFCAYIGTVFGVGLYSLPYVMSQSGIWVYAGFLVVVSMLVFLANLMFAEVVLHTPAQQRFLGYVGTYVGPRAEKIFGWITLIGFWGTFLAYLLVWGQFAHTVFSDLVPVSRLGFSLIFFVLTFFAIYRGSRTVESLNIVMLAVVGALVLVLFVLGAPYIDTLALVPENAEGYILPYGTIMFALWGAGIIPEVVNQLRTEPKKIKKLLVYGQLLPVVIGILFALFVSGISGNATTKEAFEGLEPFIGRTAVVIGSLMGMITIALSYMNLGWVSRNILHFDLGYKKPLAMLGSVVPALVILLLGFDNFVIVMSIVGAVFLGLQGLMIFTLYKKTRNVAESRVPSILNRAVHPKVATVGIILFITGVLVEVGLVVHEILISKSV